MFNGKNIIIVLSQQRSGSHYFKSLLKNSGGVCAFDGEALYPEFSEGNDKGRFFDFFYEKILEDKRNLLITNYRVVDNLFFDYFSFLANAVEDLTLAFDFKIDQIRPFPRFYHFVSRQNFKVILLARRNSIARMLSYEKIRRYIEFGEKSGFLPDIHHSKIQLEPFEIDVDQVIKTAVSDFDELSWVQNVLTSNGCNFIKVFYEDLISSSDNEQVFKKIEAFTEIRKLCRSASTVRQGGGNLSEDFLNFNELKMEVDRRQLSHLFCG